MPFANASPGQETRRYGDYIDAVAAADVYAGDAVTIDANGEVAPVAANGADKVVGVAYISGSAGEKVTIKTHGTMVAKVELDAAVGGTVGSHDGSAANVDEGELSTVGDEYYVLDLGTKDDPETGNSTEYAEVLKL